MNMLDDYLAATDKLAQLHAATNNRNALYNKMLELLKFIDPAVYAIEKVERAPNPSPFYIIVTKAQVSYNVRQTRSFVISESDILRIERVKNDIDWLRKECAGKDV